MTAAIVHELDSLKQSPKSKPPKIDPAEQRLFILDTNVLMHDPTSLFRFQEHDIYLPMTVLEELDRGKKGMSDVARNVRQVSRFLDELLADSTPEDIQNGLPLNTLEIGANGNLTGRLYFQTQEEHAALPESLPGETADNHILETAISMQDRYSVTLVTKDINLRIKATVLGIHSEDYRNDKVLEDADLLNTGFLELPAGFWEEHGKSMDSWQEEGHTYYRIKGPLVQGWMPSLFLHDAQEDTDYIVRKIEGEEALIERAHNYRTDNHSVWGVTARNQEQNYALNLLLDPEIDFVTMLGPAGTGKTLLTLAAALHLTLDKQAFREIIITRVTVPIGEDIGFLPGSEEEKMEPWMGAVMDNLEALTANAEGGEWERAATSDLIGQRVKIRSMNFMRGRTFYNRFLIIDEAQNLTPKQMKTLVTRAGPGTKVVCIGNIAQIDTPYLTETSSGLTYVVDRMKAWEHSGHVTLRQGERSRLSDYAIGVL